MKGLADKVIRLLFEDVLDKVHLWNLLPYDYLDSGAATALCHLFDGKICYLILELFTDGDPSADDASRADVATSNIPAGDSYRCLIHYCQLINQKEEIFKRYNYDSIEKN